MPRRTAAATRPRTLTEALRALTADQLADLLRLRPDLTYPLPHDLTELGSRSTTPTSVARAVDGLDAWCRLVAEALAACPDPASTADVSALLGEPAAVTRAVDALRRRALLWGADDQLHLVRPVREAFEPHPGGLAAPSPRPLTPAQVEAALAACDPAVRPVLDRLLWSPTGAVRNAERAVAVQAARSPVEQLLAHGLLRPQDADTVVLPREVAWVLRGGRFSRHPVPPTAPTVGGRVRTPPLVDSAGAGAAFGLLHDVELAVHAVETVPHRLLRTGGVAARDVTALGRRMGTDAAHATFVLECAAAAGLVAPGGNLCLLPTADFDRWAGQDGPSRWLLLARSWLAAPRWFSASAEPGTHPLGPEADASSAPAVRRLLLGLAAALEPGTVPDLGGLTEALAWHRPRLTRGPVDAATLVDWTWREAGWLGAVALGGVSAFAASLDREDAALPAELAALFPEPVHAVILQADLTAVAPGPLAYEVAGELRLLAEQESRGGGGVYRFSDGSLRRAFDVGWSAAEVHAWLGEHSVTPVPQPLAYLVDDVARRHGSIRVGSSLSYLRSDDATEVATLLGHPGAASLGLRAVAPGVLVAGVEPAELVAFLHGLGQTPAVEDEGGRTMTPPPGQRAPRPTGPDPLPAVRPEEVAASVLAAERNHPRHHAAGVDSTEQTLERLRVATQQASPVWVAWVAADGSPTERELAPLDLTGGSVRAVDRSSAQVVTIPLARISRVGAAPGGV
ncbi:Helicase conserved C-terminal domain-containing protein [Friedmanniella luteola]|uniref:Helicase conserved C-terminal domain-containing protein n=1 Tax=Friedmanniella luteola TaxID=546871 RepID=A0A1H1MC11_9ACTN|nr:helicase-associated domain-containing protein [Friedmanniella luteola]SDR84384.1 Helicase conserved C-terminal domain-containing protein [Friedmanniella luteola]